METEIAVSASKLSRHFGAFKAVDEISFDVKKGGYSVSAAQTEQGKQQP